MEERDRTWYHFEFGLVDNDVGDIRQGRAPSVETLDEDHMYFEFWVPGNRKNLSGEEMYIFSAYVGWKHWRIQTLESSFVRKQGIQSAIRKHLDASLPKKHILPNEDDRYNREEFLANLFDERQSVWSYGRAVSDYEIQHPTHEDFNWSHQFALFLRVRLP